MLDQMIILESLFQKGNERQELSYRLSLRVARFCGRDSQERKAIFGLMREAYNLRSRLVHGDQSTGSDSSIQQRVDDLIRTVLLKCCEAASDRADPKLFEKICDEMDDKALEA